MGRVRLSVGDTAKSPFFIKQMGIRVYTVEELCYCISENTFLVDEDLASSELSSWILRECGLEELSLELDRLLREGASAGSYVSAVLEYTGYLSQEEAGAVARFLEDSASLSGVQKQKARADYLMDAGRYEEALSQYALLLRRDDGQDALFTAKLHHNMGTAYASLFLFEKAAGCFKRAYACGGMEESRMQYLAARRLLLKEDQYIAFVAGDAETYYRSSLELEQRIEKAEEAWKESRQKKGMDELRACRQGRGNEYYGKLERMTEKIKEDYRRMVEEN